MKKTTIFAIMIYIGGAMSGYGIAIIIQAL
jgi:hypothetical protein